MSLKFLPKVAGFLCLFAMLKAGLVQADEVAVSSLNLGKIRQDYGKPQVDRSIDKNPLTVHGVKFEHGIGTHAYSLFFVDLHGTATRFTASAGIDDEVHGSVARMKFAIYGDGKPLWQSSDLKPGSPAESVDLPLQGVKTLVLYVIATGGSISFDHADWLSPVIQYTGSAPVAIDPPAPDPATEVGILTPPAPATPRINGAKIFGVHPGHPFLFTIAATGTRPMAFSADHLPRGLQLDPASGQITGTAPAAGNYPVTLHARNALGDASRPLLIKVGDTIALTPPMGWNSWNCFAAEVSDEKVRSIADVMVQSGLINHGWTYVNIDDFWQVNPGSKDPTLHGPQRNPDGTIHPNPRFPDMKALADYIHAKGLKAGLYSSPGAYTCGGCTASYQHEEQDVQTYTAWGFDYLKYDWCSYESVYKKEDGGKGLAGMQKPYRIMGAALAKSSRDIVYSLCQYGMGDVFKWGAEVGGNSWRTTGDIGNSWGSMWGNAAAQVGAAPYCAPGHYNDPDMLIVGKIGWGNPKPTKLTHDEQYTHISLWCLISSPLLIGCDMSNLDPFTLNLLTNDEVLAVDQDPLCKQATRVGAESGGEVFAKPLEDGSWAVGLFNPTPFPQAVSVHWSDLPVKGKQIVRDLWRQKDLGTEDTGYTATIAAHGVLFLRVRQAAP